MLSLSHGEGKWGEALSKACYDLYIKHKPCDHYKGEIFT